MKLEGLVYTGIGSRQTPMDWLVLFENLGKRLAEHGMILRSGGALGADWAWERGCDLGGGGKEIYLPWNRFKPDPKDPWVRTVAEPGVFCLDEPAAREIAARYHPYWDNLSDPVRKLMARNVHQILGPDLAHPTKLVIFWAREERGEVQGGTGQAIRLARALSIPCFNMALSETQSRLQKFFTELRAL